MVCFGECVYLFEKASLNADRHDRRTPANPRSAQAATDAIPLFPLGHREWAGPRKRYLSAVEPRDFCVLLGVAQGEKSFNPGLFLQFHGFSFVVYPRVLTGMA
jgi:hypothetical protein